jgi:hypothetical protein
MRRLLMIAVAACMAVGLATPAMASFSPSVCQPDGTGCTKGGVYHNVDALINGRADGNQVRVTWKNVEVQSWKFPGNPLYWTVGVAYQNYGSSSITVSCTGGWVKASYVGEYMQGGRGNNGYVAAESTTCSQNPGKQWNLPPGGLLFLYATFHNVPWPGTQVSIGWGEDGQGPYIDPFAGGLIS